MKGLNFESGIFKRLADVLAVCVSALALSGQAMADVAAPPPSVHNEPTAGYLRYENGRLVGKTQGAWGTWDAGRNQLNPSSRPQFNGSSRTSEGHVGNKTLNVNFRDNFGNSAGGQIRTQTRTPGSSTLSKAAGAYAAGSIAGSVLGSSNAQKAAGYLGEGRYGDAAFHAAAAFDVFNIGGGARSLWDNFWASREGRDIQKEVRDAAEKKARDAAAAAEAAEAARREAYKQADTADTVSLITYRDYGETKYFPMAHGEYIAGVGEFKAGTRMYKRSMIDPNLSYKSDFVLPPPTGGSYGETYYIQTDVLMNEQITPEIREKMRNQNTPNLDVQDLLLNQQEIEAILNKRLDALLNSQQANADAITALLNAMWGSGLINTGNTQTNVTGGDAANTFTTAPYTPADGQTAQQTQFIVNNNGNVITNIVPRPDLAPHSSQAPTRQPIGGQSQNTQSPNNPGTAQPAPNPGQSDKAEKPDICKSNPNNIACADLGNTDYTDPELPQETRNLSFNPADIFSSNGMCPQPKSVRVFNASVEISYKPLCDIAAGIRAIVILAGVMAALYMVWGEVQNG